MARRQPSSVLSICISLILLTSSVRTLNNEKMLHRLFKELLQSVKHKEQNKNITNFMYTHYKITCQIWHRPLHSAHSPCIKQQLLYRYYTYVKHSKKGLKIFHQYTCQKWLQLLHHVRCRAAAQRPRELHPSKQWNDGKMRQWGAHSTLTNKIQIIIHFISNKHFSSSYSNITNE